MELIALALAPVVFIMTYVYMRDEYDREPLIHLIIAFVLGTFTAIPVVIVGEQLRTLLNVSMESNPIDLLTYAFIVVALVEEGMKYLVLRWYCYQHEEFDEPYDGIMYGVTVSMGFAAIENILYVLGDGGGIETGILRMFTAVPAHAVFGIMMGYFVGKAKFVSADRAFFERMKGLALAVLLHGLYDYFLFLGWGYLALLSFLLVFLGIIFSRKAMRLHKEISPHNPKNKTGGV